MPSLSPLLDQQTLDEGVRQLAQRITAHYADRPVTIVGVLTGSIIFLADLIRLLPMPLRIGLIQASSYRGPVVSPGTLVIKEDLLPDLEGADVLVLDDIFDTGYTLTEVVGRLKELRAATVQTAVLLRKRGRQEVETGPDFSAFEIPNLFVVGYGLDYNSQYRNLPYVAALTPDDVEEPGEEEAEEQDAPATDSSAADAAPREARA
jgi:hypoxanthine phosphoribosyltransferase